MGTDPITLEVIANALKSLVYEMDAAIERTSMSIIIREQHDFGMSLVDHRGWVVAGTTFAGQSLAEYAAAHPVNPGDVVMFNDPYISHGEISHLGRHDAGRTGLLGGSADGLGYRLGPSHGHRGRCAGGDADAGDRDLS